MATTLLLPLFLLLLISTPFSAQTTNHTLLLGEEIQALTSFKLNLHDPLGALHNWDPSSPSAPCDWLGVTCSNSKNHRVKELSPPRFQPAGPLTDQLPNLRMLRKLTLYYNSFNGTIPPSLYQCTLLLSLFLQHNSFSGPISPAISNLTALVILDLAGNQLSGVI